MKKNQKLYIIRKYVYADNSKQALKKEKDQHADDIWVDEEWKKTNMYQQSGNTIGFNTK